MKAKFLISLTLLLYTQSILFSQSISLTPSQTWFLQERFLVADLNADAFLDMNEIHQWKEIYEFYENEEVFKLTDKNHDGHLSLYELADMHGEEIHFLQKEDALYLEKLSEEHGYANLRSAEYLRTHPQLLESLFSNYKWLTKNRKLAESFYEDPHWMRLHEETEMSLHKNLRWLVANPELANELYTNQQITCKLPKLLTWRTDHKAFMSRYQNSQRMLTTAEKNE